mmetsp:Transcript_3900/g.17977  ORF Transcript_3900/g.17977 Transcript_3900/m.17977 type:complete len:211 (+) Transcript_3900:700-1332(+)
MPHRRHVLADGDGLFHDHAAARRDAVEARQRHASVLRRPAGGARRQRERARGRSFRLSGHQETVAVGVEVVLRRPRAIRVRVLLHVQGVLRRRRRVQARRRRVLLDHRPRRRRHQRLRTPHGNRGGRVRARASPRVLRGGGRRHAPRDQGCRDLLLRRAQGRAGAERRHDQGAQGDRAQGDWTHRHTGRDTILGRFTEDPLGEDHAADLA